MLNCPKGHGPMTSQIKARSLTFRDQDISVESEVSVCPVCGFEGATVEATGALQKAIADAYRQRVGLLTSQEIKDLRKAKGLSQDELATRLRCGIASIKRWEGGCIQSSSMDKTLRSHLQRKPKLLAVSDCTGGREFSLPRTKLVLLEFGNILQKEIFKKGKKLLYWAKYLWYSDVISFRIQQSSMTGATYARLPQGPQLNNYRDLVDLIRDADEYEADPLTENEKRIIISIATTFPTPERAYKAAHKEPFLEEIAIGGLIPYSYADRITQISIEAGQ